MTSRDTALSRIGLVFALGLSLTPAALAQSTADVDQIDATARTRIDALFADYNNDNTAGCAVGVMRNGQLVYARGYGMGDLEHGMRITSNKPFDTGSMAKQFTAAAIVLLAKEGRLAFTDNVRKFLPELPNYGTTLTINHLLYHTSGLRDYLALLLLAGKTYEEVVADPEVLAMIMRQQKLNFTPGSRAEYSNTGYFLLGVIVQRITGQSLAEFARERLFSPLNMNQALFRDSFAMLIHNRVMGYTFGDADEAVLAMTNWEPVGDGAAWLSINDTPKWDENFYSQAVGGPGFTQEMERTGTLSNGTPLTQARGLTVDTYRGLRRVHHSGDSSGFHVMMERYPSAHTSIAVFCNTDGADAVNLSHRVADIVLANVFPLPPPPTPGNPPVPSLPYSQLVGSYFDSASNTVFRIFTQDNLLLLQFQYLTVPLIATGPASFALAGAPGTVDFIVQGQQPASAMRLTFEGDLPIQSNRFVPVSVSPPGLQQYTGKFSSAELGVTWSFSVSDGQLALTTGDERTSVPIDGALVPAQADAFNGDVGYLRFTRSAGQITGFNLSSNRVNLVRFQVATCAN